MSARNFLMALAATLLAGPTAALAAWDLNMTQSVTPVGKQIYDLHMLVLWICTIAGILVFGVIIYSIINHRASKHPKPADFHESTTVEIIWTTVPLLILVAIAVPATSTLLDLEDTNDADMTLHVTAYQWKWKYEYLDEGISFFSNLHTASRDASIAGDPSNYECQGPKNSDETGEDCYMLEVDKPIVLPTKKKVRFVVGSNDVIHSWWVRGLGVKQDTVPGFINDTWAYIEEEGVYRGQCAELCGKDHGYMPIVVIAKNETDYKKWVADEKAAAEAEANSGARDWTMAELMAKGETVYNASCAACHQAGGQGLPGVFPALKGSPIATGPAEKHVDVVMHGVAGTAMQAFGAQLSNVDLAAVITYERNAFGNDKGDLIQPSAIAAARK